MRQRGFLSKCIIAVFAFLIIASPFLVNIKEVSAQGGDNSGAGIVAPPNNSGTERALGKEIIKAVEYNRPSQGADGLGVDNAIASSFLYIIFSGIMWYNGLVAGIGGGLFDYSVEHLVVGINDFLGVNASDSSKTLLGSITDLWEIFRDIGNILIIFSLLYIAILIILRGDGFSQGRAVGMILIAAVLINFSLFFTKTAFDVSNQVSIEILNTAKISSAEGTSIGLIKGKTFTELFKVKEGGYSVFRSGEKEITYIIQAVFAAVLLSLVGFVFLFASLVLATRVVVFLILFITAALGMTAKFIPMTQKLGNMWWGNLVKYSLMLPAFTLLLYVAFQVSNAVSGKIDFGTSILSGDFIKKSAESLIYLLIMLAFFSIAVFGSLKAGSIGVGTSKGVLDKAASWGQARLKSYGRRVGGATVGGGALAARATVGGISRKYASSEKLKAKSRQEGFWGGAARVRLKAADKVGNEYTYDPRNIKVGKTTLGKDLKLGEGIKGYGQTVEEKQKKLDKDKKKEMELLGFDKLKADPRAIFESEFEKTQISKKLKNEKNKLSVMRVSNVSEDQLEAQVEKVEDTKKQLARVNLDLQKLNKQGEKSYLETKNSKMARVANRLKLNFAQNKALQKFQEKSEKEWIKDKDKKAIDDLKTALGSGAASPGPSSGSGTPTPTP
jgi:hypothetical protein